MRFAEFEATLLAVLEEIDPTIHLLPGERSRIVARLYPIAYFDGHKDGFKEGVLKVTEAAKRLTPGFGNFR